jgi:hypothetical protein
MASRRFAKRFVTSALGGIAAGIVGVALAMEPAAAATTTADQTFEFVPPGGTFASCTIHIQADFPYGGANSGRAITSVSGANSACTSGVTTLTGAEYRATNDDFVTEPYTWTYGTSHSHTYSNVKRDFQTYHQVYFPACGCASQVYTLSTPNPK